MTAILETVDTAAPDQVWPSMRIVPMAEVLQAESSDGGPDVASVLDWKVDDPGFPALVESIRTHGLAKGYEPSYRPGYVSEGHHRIAALMELGAQWCPVNDNWDPSEPWVAPDGSTPARCAHCPDCSWRY